MFGNLGLPPQTRSAGLRVTDAPPSRCPATRLRSIPSHVHAAGESPRHARQTIWPRCVSFRQPSFVEGGVDFSRGKRPLLAEQRSPNAAKRLPLVDASLRLVNLRAGSTNTIPAGSFGISPSGKGAQCNTQVLHHGTVHLKPI